MGFWHVKFISTSFRRAELIFKDRTMHINGVMCADPFQHGEVK